jgi:hypothetical protein
MGQSSTKSNRSTNMMPRLDIKINEEFLEQHYQRLQNKLLLSLVAQSQSILSNETVETQFQPQLMEMEY